MSTLEDLSELYSQGGITVCTPEDQILVRSVIQPDADIITWVSPDVLKDPSIWDTHLRQVRAKFNFARRLRMVIRNSWFVTPLPGLIGIVTSLVEKEFVPLLHGLGISLLFFVVRIGLITLLRFYIRRKINRILAG